MGSYWWPFSLLLIIGIIVVSITLVPQLRKLRTNYDHLFSFFVAMSATLIGVFIALHFAGQQSESTHKEGVIKLLEAAKVDLFDTGAKTRVFFVGILDVGIERFELSEYTDANPLPFPNLFSSILDSELVLQRISDNTLSTLITSEANLNQMLNSINDGSISNNEMRIRVGLYGLELLRAHEVATSEILYLKGKSSKETLVEFQMYSSTKVTCMLSDPGAKTLDEGCGSTEMAQEVFTPLVPSSHMVWTNFFVKPNELIAASRYNAGVELSKRGSWENALEQYDESILQNHQFTAAYNNRGLVYVELGQPERAIQDYDEAIQLDPQNAAAYNNRGNSYYELGEYKRAIQDFDEAIRISPQDAIAYNNRGNAYAAQEQYLRAIRDYSEAIRRGPQDAVVYKNRGISYADSGDYELAIRDYGEAIRLDPQLAEAYVARSLAYTALGMDTVAEQDVDHAVDLGRDRDLLEVSIEESKKWR